jgi:hypothetical protein
MDRIWNFLRMSLLVRISLGYIQITYSSTPIYLAWQSARLYFRRDRKALHYVLFAYPGQTNLVGQTFPFSLIFNTDKLKSSWAISLNLKLPDIPEVQKLMSSSEDPSNPEDPYRALKIPQEP